MTYFWYVHFCTVYVLHLADPVVGPHSNAGAADNLQATTSMGGLDDGRGAAQEGSGRVRRRGSSSRPRRTSCNLNGLAEGTRSSTDVLSQPTENCSQLDSSILMLEKQLGIALNPNVPITAVS